MHSLLQATSTLTDRYQTTIPEPVRELLQLHKRDKITYIVEGDGRVSISRANEDDPVLGNFLLFLANDIKQYPTHIRSMSATLMDRAQRLVSGVEVDLEAPLEDKDE